MLFTISVILVSCKSDPHEPSWSEETQTICQFLNNNQQEYSKSYRILEESKLLNTLCGYNPYGDGYTLFLPTNGAIDNFIQQNPDLVNFEEMFLDTNILYPFARYHVVKKRLHTDEFPDGALRDSTLTGDRLATGFFTDGENQIININNTAPIVESNLKFTNGFIHIISEVLQQPDFTGFDFLQQNEEYSILSEAVEISGIKKQMWWKKYSILAEHDSIYNKKGIYTVQDLIARVATPGKKLNDKFNSFYRFVGYHFVGGEYYLSDFNYGDKDYATMASTPLTVIVGTKFKINPGIETFGFEVSGTGDTIKVDYISPVWKECNTMTSTGPVHSITELLHYEPFPQKPE